MAAFVLYNTPELSYFYRSLSLTKKEKPGTGEVLGF